MENEPGEFFCTECDKVVNKDDKVCNNCGADLTEIVEESDTLIDEPQFKTLHHLGGVISFLGWIVVALGVASFIFMKDTFPVGTAFFGALLIAIIGIVIVANGQLLSCFVSIEWNTKKTNELLTELLEKRTD